jgi:dipeptidyl aminopeptidase/acylaminoacyl peptidase
MVSSIDAWLALSAATSPAVASDARTLWYLSTVSGVPQIWRRDLDTEAPPVQVTHHDDRVMLIRTSPVDASLAYGIDSGGDEHTQLRLIAPDGSERKLTDDPSVIHGWGGFSPDGKRIAFTANDRDPAHTDILVMNADGSDRRRVLAAEGPHEVGGWHPDGRRVLAYATPRDLESRPFLIDVASGTRSWLAPAGKRRVLQARWRKDGAGYWCLSDHGAEHLRLCWYELARERFDVLYEFPGDVDRLVVSPDQATIAIVLNAEGYSRLKFVDVVSHAISEAPSLPAGVIGEMAWAGNARLVLALSRPTQPSTLWHVEPGLHRACALAVLPRQPTMPAAPADPIQIHFPTADGGRAPGWLYRPQGAAPNGGFPALLWVHGGPTMQALPEFRADIQWCVQHGMAVLVPNIRGSTGYGRRYAEADDRELRPAAIADVDAARRYLAGRTDIDAGRIAIMGQSYGGWMVLAATTRYPAGWACAIDFYGIASWTTFFEHTGPWRKNHRAAEYGDPRTDSALLHDLSPLKDSDRIAAPLLVAHGLTDPRVPPLESEQIVAALRRRNHPVQHVTIPDEGHGFVKRRNRETVYGEVARFLAHHLKL